jgi:hypothetical protein
MLLNFKTDHRIRTSIRPSAGGNPTQFVRHVPSSRLPAERAFPEDTAKKQPAPAWLIGQRMRECHFLDNRCEWPIKSCDLRVNEYRPPVAVKATVPGLAEKRAWAGEAAIAVQPRERRGFLLLAC